VGPGKTFPPPLDGSHRVSRRDDSVVVVFQAKIAELNAMNVKVEELVRSSVEKDAEAGKEVSNKMKSLQTQLEKLSATVEKRIKMAAINVSFQNRVKQVRTLRICFSRFVVISIIFVRPGDGSPSATNVVLVVVGVGVVVIIFAIC